MANVWSTLDKLHVSLILCTLKTFVHDIFSAISVHNINVCAHIQAAWQTVNTAMDTVQSIIIFILYLFAFCLLNATVIFMFFENKFTTCPELFQLSSI